MIDSSTPNGSYIPWGWQTFLDTDSDPTTGFRVGDIGADFIIEATSVSQYSGSNNSWDWQTVAIAEVAYNNDIAELSLPLAIIGNPSSIRLNFKGNNIAVGGSNSDFYPDNAETRGGTDNYFSYSLVDALARVSIRPSTADQSVSVIENTSTAIRLNATDPDGGNLSYILVKAPEHGTLTTMNEVVNYQPNADFVGADSFEYIVNDGVFDSSVATVNISMQRAEDSTTATGSVDTTNTSGSTSEESGGGSMGWAWHFKTSRQSMPVLAHILKITTIRFGRIAKLA